MRPSGLISDRDFGTVPNNAGDEAYPRDAGRGDEGTAFMEHPPSWSKCDTVAAGGITTTIELRAVVKADGVESRVTFTAE